MSSDLENFPYESCFIDKNFMNQDKENLRTVYKLPHLASLNYENFIFLLLLSLQVCDSLSNE